MCYLLYLLNLHNIYLFYFVYFLFPLQFVHYILTPTPLGVSCQIVNLYFHLLHTPVLYISSPTSCKIGRPRPFMFPGLRLLMNRTSSVVSTSPLLLLTFPSILRYCSLCNESRPRCRNKSSTRNKTYYFFLWSPETRFVLYYTLRNFPIKSDLTLILLYLLPSSSLRSLLR